jgi:hypothetical protein
MEQYLSKEKEILELTESDFFDHKKVVTNWYSVKNGVVTEHNKLVNAMGLEPDYLILSRYERDEPKRRITVYFNNQVAVVPYIPFGQWRLFDNTEQYGRHKYFTLQDPTGVIRTISLTEYLPYIPIHIKPYLEHQSFEAYDSSNSKDNTGNEKVEKKLEEITLEPGKSYVISIKEKNQLTN